MPPGTLDVVRVLRGYIAGLAGRGGEQREDACASLRATFLLLLGSIFFFSLFCEGTNSRKPRQNNSSFLRENKHHYRPRRRHTTREHTFGG
jgi:hypothetical protein